MLVPAAVAPCIRDSTLGPQVLLRAVSPTSGPCFSVPGSRSGAGSASSCSPAAVPAPDAWVAPRAHRLATWQFGDARQLVSAQLCALQLLTHLGQEVVCPFALPVRLVVAELHPCLVVGVLPRRVRSSEVPPFLRLHLAGLYELLSEHRCHTPVRSGVDALGRQACLGGVQYCIVGPRLRRRCCSR